MTNSVVTSKVTHQLRFAEFHDSLILGKSSSYTKMVYLVSPILFVFLNTDRKPLTAHLLSSTLNVNFTLTVIPCNFWGYCRSTNLRLLSFTKWFCIQVSIIQYFIIENYVKMQNIPNFVAMIGMGLIKFQSSISILVNSFMRSAIGKITTTT